MYRKSKRNQQTEPSALPCFKSKSKQQTDPLCHASYVELLNDVIEPVTFARSAGPRGDVYTDVRIHYLWTYVPYESVDSLCRDGTDTPIVRVHTKAF